MTYVKKNCSACGKLYPLHGESRATIYGHTREYKGGRGQWESPRPRAPAEKWHEKRAVWFRCVNNEENVNLIRALASCTPTPGTVPIITIARSPCPLDPLMSANLIEVAPGPCVLWIRYWIMSINRRVLNDLICCVRPVISWRLYPPLGGLTLKLELGPCSWRKSWSEISHC